jgi:hypothetical protein
MVEQLFTAARAQRAMRKERGEHLFIYYKEVPWVYRETAHPRHPVTDKRVRKPEFAFHALSARYGRVS